MEGLALTPDGKTLVGIMQAPLIQDAAKGEANKTVRIVTIDIASGATHEYAYNLTTGTGVSDIVALNDHQFLVDERDGNGRANGNDAVAKQLFIIDTDGATDVTDLTGQALKDAAIPKSGPFLDIVAALVSLLAMVAFLKAQQDQYAPAVASITQIANGQHVVTVRYDAPGPMGLGGS